MTPTAQPLPPGALLPFVQLELARPLGPPAGSYLVAGEADATPDTLVITARDVEPERWWRRPRAVDAEQPAPVALTLATHVLVSRACAGKRDAAALLAGWRGSPEEARALVERTLDVVNLAVRAHRAAARDPYAAEVSSAEPRAVRIGIGTAAEVVAGAWTEAFAAPPAASSRTRDERLRGAVGVADVLAGRAVLDPAFELLVRAEADIDQRRLDCAAPQLRAAAEVLAARAPADAAAAQAVDAARRLAHPDASAEELLLRADRLADRLWALLASGPGPR